MAMLKNLYIKQFRGIRNLNINNLNIVNILVGNNNCGKTSFLEALQLLNPACNMGNILKVAKQRENLFGINTSSIYENFIYMFPHNTDKLEIEINAECNDKKISFNMKGKEENLFIDSLELKKQHLLLSDVSGEIETRSFNGSFIFNYGNVEKQEKIFIHSYSRIMGVPILESEDFKIIYNSPFEHLKGNIIDKLIKNESYKEICLKALQLFEPDIKDIFYIKSDFGNKPIEYINHKELGNMPLSTCGDGIKKVLVLANSIAMAQDGILLIDEIETAIHKKYYYDIFNFLIKTSKIFNVQLFITTHSLEAIDGLLETQNYNEQKEKDDIAIITLKKEVNNTYSRILSGREVFQDRENFGFEVRL